MFQTLRNAWKIEDLRKKLLFTLLILVIVRLGCAIPVPFLDPSRLQEMLDSTQGNLLGYLNLLTGGAFAEATLFALGVSPYITASIVIQLLTVAIPSLERMAKEGPEGQKKIKKITRYSTIGLAILQAYAYYTLLRSSQFNAVKYTTGAAAWISGIAIVLAFSAGAMLVVWLGERIDEKGIGNGISLIIFCGIVARFPQAISTVVDYLKVGTISPFQLLLFLVIALAMILMVIEVNEGQRRIPIQYAKRVIGRRMYGGHSTYLPLKVNQAGVIPIIFASSILMLPITLAQFIHVSWVQSIGNFFGWGTWPNTICYGFLIFIFTYFYTAISVNIKDLADNMKKYGGFIPGIRPGQPTMMYVDKVLSRITLTGAVFLAFIAILPNFIGNITGIQGVYFGGTSLLIIVGVALDTMRQAQSYMVTRNYQGFIK